VQIPGLELGLAVDLAQASDGHWIGSITVPGFGVKGSPLADIVVNGSDVAFVVKGVFGDPKLSGHLAADRSLTGDFAQAGNTAPFTLRQQGPAQVEPPRAGTPVQKELEGEWRGEFDLIGNTMHARLKLTNQPTGTVAQFALGLKEVNDLPVSFVTQEGDWLTVEAHAYGAAYEGRFHAGTNEIEGVFEQAGLEFPLVLHKAAPGAAK